jgi:hypothetical protein
MYDQGIGVPQSDFMAKRHWLAAAAKGGRSKHAAGLLSVPPQAQFNLGLYAESGRGDDYHSGNDDDDGGGEKTKSGSGGGGGENGGGLRAFLLGGRNNTNKHENQRSNKNSIGGGGGVKDPAAAMRWYHLAASQVNESSKCSHIGILCFRFDIFSAVATTTKHYCHYQHQKPTTTTTPNCHLTTNLHHEHSPCRVTPRPSLTWALFMKLG